MENRFDHNQQEEQGWGNYATPPGLPGRRVGFTAPSSSEMGLCLQVREMLPHLLENDGVIRPEMARQVYAHLSVCPGCTAEFDEMQRVIQLMDKLPPAEMPRDFSLLIMQRILSPDGPIPQRPPLRAGINLSDAPAEISAVRTENPETRATRAALGQPVFTEALSRVKVNSSLSTVHRVGTQNVTQNVVIQASRTTLSTLQRLTAASVLTAVMAFMLTTAWGRNALGSDLDAVHGWMQQIGDALSKVPLFGRMTAYLFAAMNQMSDSVSETYRTLGANAAKGLTLDIALCACACFFLAARRQRGQRLGI